MVYKDCYRVSKPYFIANRVGKIPPQKSIPIWEDSWRYWRYSITPQVNESPLLKKLIRCALYYLTRDSAITLRVRSQGSPPFPQGYKHSQQKWILAKKLRPAWFRRCTFHELNLIEYVRLWSDTGATSDSDGAPCLEPKLSSTKVRQTLSNLTLLPHQTKTAAPNWFRHRSFAVLNSSVRFCTLVKMRLNQA